MMETASEPSRGKVPRTQTITLLLIVVLSLVASAWVMVTVSSTSRLPSSAFVELPTTPLSGTGERVVLVSVSAIAQQNMAVGVEGYVKTISGTPVAGAQIYATYYLQGSYRTQVATTDQNGHFELRFPMNWTGWLPIVFTYYGDAQHQGFKQRLNIAGTIPTVAPAPQ